MLTDGTATVLAFRSGAGMKGCDDESQFSA